MADTGYYGREDDDAQRPSKRRRRDDNHSGLESESHPRRHDSNNERRQGGSRRRSRSPDSSRHKSRHPDDHSRGDRQHHRRRERRAPPPAASVQLPYDARPLSKSELDVFRPLLARYLDVQKSKDMGDMDEREIRGRWKSFVSKWNEGTLAGSWYDPELFQETRQSELWKGFNQPSRHTREDSQQRERTPEHQGHSFEQQERGRATSNEPGSGDEDDDYGPVLPGLMHPPEAPGTRHGPGVPSLQDLEVQREMNEEDRLDRVTQLRLERKADRLQQKTHLDELVPRAAAGTRERQLEKKKEVNEKMKGFRERSPGAAEVNDGELMGGGDSFDEVKRMKASAERKKTEKEIRREEIARAKNAEREERLKEYREKEDKAMVMLKELAKQRFG